MRESARYILQILVFLALILAVGTGGYMLIEHNMRVSDAFYMTVTAITPTQFDEVHKLSFAGKYFTVALVFCGFGAVVAFATQFARLIIQSELEGVGVITRKQMRRRIGRMKNHYIVCGFGEIGGAICGELKDQQLPFVVIADDEVSVAAITREGYPLVRGNPTADASLKEAEIERAIGAIAVLADDADNLFISLAARELNPKLFIIARGEDPGVEDRILRAGADIVVSPMQLGGRQIAGLIKQQANVVAPANGSTEASSVMGLGLTIYRHASESAITLAEVLEKMRSVGAAGIHRRSGSFEAMPLPTVEVHPDDVVVVIKKTDEPGNAFHHRPSGKTILLADDHRALRLLFARKLASAGHEVLQAASGDEALIQARERRPDLIVLDVNMPGVSGYEVCTSLRQSGHFSETPIILYSGDESEEFISHGGAAGASLCLRKTSKSSELLARIEEVFAKHSESSNRNREAGNEVPVAAAELSQPESMDGVFDMRVALENTEGNRQLVNELIEVVLEDTPCIMERIEAAMEQRDLPALRREAHSLKSSVAILGASRASATAAKLELAASNDEFETIQDLHRVLRTNIEALMGILEGRLQD